MSGLIENSKLNEYLISLSCDSVARVWVHSGQTWNAPGIWGDSGAKIRPRVGTKGVNATRPCVGLGLLCK